MFNFLAGYKTYIVAAGAVITAIGAYASGAIPLEETIKAVFEAVAVATLRKGIKNDTAA